MATSKQEQLYNEIVEYYSFADRLIASIQDSSHKLSEQQFSIIEEVVIKLEECADQLTTQYIEFIKNGQSEKITDIVRQSLNKIMSKIEECQNKILIMYNSSESNKNAE